MAGFPAAQERGTGIEFSTGIMGSISYFQVGLLLPKIKDTFFIDVKARACSATTWTTFINMDTSEQVSFHPVVVGGVLSMGGESPFVDSAVRMHGGMDLFLGHSFTPYDGWFYETANLIGPNLTFAILGFFGFEYFTSDASAFFIDAGGGYKSLFADDENMYAIASSWLGSGFGIRMGTNIYF